MSVVLYRKYRPIDFDHVTGQEHIIDTLRNAVRNNMVAHAYLFSGPRGTGKTSVARILAKAVNCLKAKDGNPCNECQICRAVSSGQFFDLMEIDAATHTQVEKMRDLVEMIHISPTQGKKKVYIIDEVHMLSKGAFNALLKTLEEPPEHVLFILATTEIHKIPATIISRCQRFDFRHLRISEIKQKLEKIAQAEGVELESGVLEYIAGSSGGGMRDSESLLGQIIALQDDTKITLKEVQNILAVPEMSIFLDLGKMVLESQYEQALVYVNQVADDGYDLWQLNKGLVECLRKILLLKVSPQMREYFLIQMTDEQIEALEEVAKLTSVSKIFKTINAFIVSQNLIKGAVLPQLPLELAITELKLNDETVVITPGSQKEIHDNASQVADVNLLSKKNTESRRLSNNSSVSKKEVAKSVVAKSPKQEERGVDVSCSEANSVVSHDKIADSDNDTLANKEILSDLDVLKNEWDDIIHDVKTTNNSLAACLTTCEPLALQEGRVIIFCPFAFHKNKLQKPENCQIIEQVAMKNTGFVVRIKFVEEREGVSVGVVHSNKATSEVEEGDLTASALHMFGGELVAD